MPDIERVSKQKIVLPISTKLEASNKNLPHVKKECNQCNATR
jgi:hypothetical protein